MRIEIDNPFATGFMAALGVFVALLLLVLFVAAVDNTVSDAKVQGICAAHDGVARVEQSPVAVTVRSRASIICRDGHYQTIGS